MDHSNKYRILHLISSSGFLGAENVVLQLSREALKTGHTATIGVIENRRGLHRELVGIAEAEGIATKVFPCRKRFDTKTVFAIRNFVKQEQPALIHSHGYKGNSYALISLRGSIPWVVTNHLWKRTTVNLKLYAYLDSRFMRYAHKVVAVSDEIASEMARLGIPSSKITVINNGIDVERFSGCQKRSALRDAFGFSDETKVIGTVASLTEEKGHVFLIQAARDIASMFSEVRFLLVGDGNKRHDLEKKVYQLGLSGKIVFAGNRKDIPELLSALDLFVLPSLKEGLPMALLEALAAGLPVVATSVGAVPKVITHNETGLLVEPGDAKALFSAISGLLSNSVTAAGLARNGQVRVHSGFSAQMMSERYFAVYDEVLAHVALKTPRLV